YVRIYTRDTKTWLKLGFEGQTVLLFLTRKLDRSGVLDGIEDPAEDVALITGVPIEIVRIGLARLLERGVFELKGTRLIAPNFIEAQSCAKSDRLRQQELRERRRSETLGTAEAEPERATEPAPVTKRDEPSRDVTTVTARHEPSQLVTPILSVPSSFLSLGERARVANETEPAEPPTIAFLPEDWTPSEAFVGEALMAGIAPDALDEAVRYWRGRRLGGDWLSAEEFFRGKFVSIRKRAEKERFAEQRERASPPVRASPRRTSGSKQPNAGRTGLESWKETV
ncbi:MAG TPA: hypothetical protein VIU86_20175, partial [Gaiellaceae bacterium]